MLQTLFEAIIPYTQGQSLRKMALPLCGRRRFAPTGIFPMLQTLFEAITPCAKTLYEKWRCRIAAGGVSRRQTFFQCFKLCLKLSYHTRKANLCEKWRCRFAAGGVSRRQAFFQCFKLCLKLLHHVQKLSTKNGVAASRQEAFHADRHFSNASNSV